MSTNYAKWSGFGGGSSVTAGNLTDVGTDGIVVTGGTGAVIGAGTQLAQHVADTTHNGYLSSTDWNTFNSKQAALTVGTLDGQTANAAGAAIASNQLFMQSADATHPGLVNNTSQTFGGTKTFTQIIDPLLVGATSSGGTLTLESTTHATKGKILFGIAGTSAYDEVNDRLGIGTATPSRTLDLNGPASSYLALSIGGTPQALFGTDVNGHFVVFDIITSQYVLVENTTGWGMGKVAPTPSAYLTLQGGAASANAAPLKILPGTNLSSAESGAIENDGNHLYYTSSVPTRFQLATTSDIPSAITALTGDVTASGPGSVAATLATVNTNVGSFGSSTAIPSFTVIGKGLITAASTNAVVAPASTLTGTTLASNVVSSSLTSVGTITSGTWTGTTIALANGGTGQTTKAPAFDALSPMTTGGDLIYGGASGTGTRLANGSANQVLQSNGTTLAPTWTTNISGNAGNVTGTVAIANGGTGQTSKAAGFDALQPMTTSGDVIYGGASGTGTRLAKGSDGQVLTLASGLPSWAAGVANYAVTTQTGTYSILTTDNVVLVNPSASFTATLPTAVGVTGKQYVIINIADDITKVVTLATTSSQTIGGSTTRKLNTLNEAWYIVSDGANWQIINHKSTTAWRNNLTFTPNNFGTVATTNYWWRRVADSMQCKITYTVGTLVAAAASLSFPTGIVLDSTKYSATASIQMLGIENGLINGTTSWSLLGGAQTLFYDGSDTAKLYFARQFTRTYTKQNGNDMGLGSGDGVSMMFEFAVSGWDE